MTIPPLEWWLSIAALLWAAAIQGAPKCRHCGTWVGVEPDLSCRACAALPGEQDGEAGNGTEGGARG